MTEKLSQLAQTLEGEFYYDLTMRTLYATDASAYREMPLAVAVPKTAEDVKKIINFARANGTSVIPRTAGTSLAGQVVGKGIVVDVSKYWNKILEVNQEEKWVRVQPGVVLDELNMYLEQFNLFFGPETSTSNRCMIGGMVGNNSCGSHSVIYGTTRDHVLELKTILADGKEATFSSLTLEEYNQKCTLPGLEGDLYRFTDRILKQPEVQNEIRNEFPKPEIKRRNTGYAIDVLLESEPFTEGKGKFNFCNLLTGSEGTLAFTTEIKLNLVPAPPKHKAVVAVHLNSIIEATQATIIGLRHKPGAIELLDDIILQCTKTNIEQLKNRFFVEGDPIALVVIEFARETEEEIDRLTAAVIADLKAAGLGYHFPILKGADINKVWALRKAGLGLMANIPGDAKGVPCIEDTAVSTDDQPAYIAEFLEILEKYNQRCVFYAHIGDGEIHLRPVLNLKVQEDRDMFYTITDEIATLVKKYRGSLSGEHGDGRVRAPFIKKMIGAKNYALIQELKTVWDPQNIFNPGKIVNAAKMNEFLRYKSGQMNRVFNTRFDFSEVGGIVQLAEKCNGSGDCRKSSIIGGTMCPSFQATHNEKDTTRARANILREFLTNSEQENKFAHDEIKEVMDLCISCKGCKSECPSNVDVSKLKAEFTYQYNKTHGVPFRSWAVANISKANRLGALFPGLTNFVLSNGFTGGLIKKVVGINAQRQLPALHTVTLSAWAKKNLPKLNPPANKAIKTVYLFCDEFTQYNDTPVGIAGIRLLTRLGYRVEIPRHEESARTYLSKGLVDEAQKLAIKNVNLLKDVITSDSPLLGIEPSAILSFRDEYPALVGDELKETAIALGGKALMIDEFLEKEFEAGNIKKESFKQEGKKIKFHGHCHQKALSSLVPTKKLLTLLTGASVEIIPSGCCGMAGSFGYEDEHYDVSMKIGNLVLFPAVNKAEATTTIMAPGTSCRHQIKDGTGRSAKHPVEVLYEALV